MIESLAEITHNYKRRLYFKLNMLKVTRETEDVEILLRRVDDQQLIHTHTCIYEYIMFVQQKGEDIMNNNKN